jgi:hypothetical protein
MLIGLNGRKQAGKDTVCERIAHKLDGVIEVERVSFADLLYESAAAALGVTVEFLQAHKSDPRYTVAVLAPNGRVVRELTIREFLQGYGTEAHRLVFGDSFWVDQVEPRLMRHVGRIVVVTDVRFENEARAVQAAGGAVVEVIGPEGRVTDDAHASEAPLPESLIDVTVDNSVRDDGFKWLDAVVDKLLRLHLGEEFSVAVPS